MDKNSSKKNHNVENQQSYREYLKYNTKDKQDEAMKILNDRFNASRLIQQFATN